MEKKKQVFGKQNTHTQLKHKQEHKRAHHLKMSSFQSK